MDIEVFFKKEVVSFEAYTDGACSGNPGPGGWGAVILNDGKELTLNGAEKNTTNNRMEMMAAIQVFKTVLEKSSCRNITIHTDSRYVKDGVTSWVATWKKNGWMTSNKTPVKNKDLWILLDDYMQKLNIEWKWVPGHAGVKYNELADTLARKAIIYLQVNG